MQLSKLLKTPLFFWSGLILLYLSTHLPGLTLLPIFADEAIYIRWAQLIITDWSQYLFFPLNDGKTPLFIWMLAPVLQLSSDPLLGGRLLAVLGGLLQVLLIVHLLKALRVNRVGQLVGALITIFAPFWFFHHRMVLMDGWLTVWLSLVTLAMLKLTTPRLHSGRLLVWWGVGVTAVWAGLMTKVPFLLAFPALLLLPLSGKLKANTLVLRLRRSVLLLVGGTTLFLLLAVTPVFPQLFNRGSDFLMPLSEVLSGRWQETVPSIPTYLGYFVSYSGWGVLVLAVIGLVQPGKRRSSWIFASSFVLFSIPIWVLGRVVFPRYLFPAMFYLTLIASLGAGTLWQSSSAPIHTLRRRFAIRSLLVLLILQLFVTSLRFVVPSLFNTSAIPFVSADRGQYLTTWSSGHGIWETYSYLQQLKQSQLTGTIQVATEGSFGSLPDGLLLYNFRQPLDRVWIEGIGYPVDSIPIGFYQRIQLEDRVLLVINSDRLQWQLEPNTLLQQHCRPYGGPCLQIWDITKSYSQFKKN